MPSGFSSSPLISQIPYVMALRFGMLNMLFTLFFCFLILHVRHRVSNGFVRNLLVVLLVFVTLFCGLVPACGHLYDPV